MKKLAALFVILSLCLFSMTACESNENKPHELNADILSEIGMTRQQLNDKYGKPIHILDLAATYVQADFRSYIFDGISKEDICGAIRGFEIEDLFLNYVESDTPEEIADRYNLTFLRAEVWGGDSVQSYFLKDNLFMNINTTYDKISPSAMEIADLTYYNNTNMGFETEKISSRYQIIYDVVIGAPEDATVEDFLNDPLIRAWGCEVKISKKNQVITTGKLSFGDYVWIDKRDYLVVPYLEELSNS